MKCPVCTGVDLNIAERQGVEIDYCPNCRGVWLDRGELDKIIERSGAQAPAYTQPEPQYQQPASYQQHYSKQNHDGGHGYGHDSHHKKKNWLSELFD
jgi:Zn-finger nucleic acid-binding protein